MMKKISYALVLLFLGVSMNLQAQDEKSATDLYNEGVALLKAKDYAGAFPLLEQAVEKASAAEEGDSTAMQVLKLAKKNGVRAAYALGNSQSKAKDYEAALATFEKGMAMGDFYALYMGKAKALDKSGKKEEAIPAYLEAASKYEEAGQDEAKVVKVYKTAFVKMYKGKAYDMIIEKAEAHPLALKNIDVNYYVGKAFNAKKQYSKALEYAKTASGMAAENKNPGKYYMFEGDVNAKLSKKSDAIAAYKKVPAGSKYAERAAYLIKEIEGK